MKLTMEQQQAILRDFIAWSGGFTPDECEREQLESYAKTAANGSLDASEVLEFLVQH